jgi:Cu+-exporting ATPase
MAETHMDHVMTGAAMKDPVCGMTVRPEKAAGHLDWGGKTFYFCSAGCLAKFRADPERYVPKAAAPAPTPGAAPAHAHTHPAASTAASAPGATPAATARPAPSHARPPAAPPAAGRGTIYTCPMHPEIERDAPGSCPKCGMALEPKTASADQDEKDPELALMARRFRISAALTVPLMALAMAHMLPGLHIGSVLAPGAQRMLELLLAAPVVLWGGWPFFQRFAASFAHRSPNMFTLIGLGVGVAFGYSLAATFAPGFFPPPSATPMARSASTSRPPPPS